MSVRVRQVWRLGHVLVTMLAMTACAGVSELTAPTPLLTPVGEVTVTPATVTVAEGSTTVLQAAVFDEVGDRLNDRALLWSSSDTSVAQVSTTGTVTALKIGSARIAVTAEGRSAVSEVTVSRRPVASVQVASPTPRVFVGATLTITATPLDDRGQPLPGRDVSWLSSDPRVAIVSGAGVVTALGPGTATISVNSEGRAATIAITVLPVPTASVDVSPANDTLIVGQSTQLTATARDSTGNALPDRIFGWSSSAGGVATVSSSGLVLGIAPGRVIISASNGDRTGVSTLNVLPRPVGAVIISPSQSALTVGQTLRLTVQITDQDGTLLVGRPVSFQSSNTAVARVAADGLVTAVSAGTVTINALSEGRRGTASITVAASPVSSVRVTPGSLTLQVGQTGRVTADALDASGAVLAQRPITWLSGAPTFFTVAADGTITARASGTGVVFASAENRIGSAAITVQGGVVASVALTPAITGMFVGDTRDFAVVVRDAAGAEISGRAVRWTSSNTGVAVVASSGRVRALAVGTTTLSATVDGVIGTLSITVTPTPVATVGVTLSASSLIPGQTATATALARSASGEVLSGRTIVWTSLTPAVATITSTGAITAVANGTSIIRATVEGVSGQVTLTVNPTPVATVTVGIPVRSLLVGQTVQAAAETRGAENQLLTGRDIVWTSSAPGVATVSTTGLVTAVAPGSVTITATSEDRSGTATLSVALVPVDSVLATLADSSILVGQTVQAAAVLRDSASNVLAGRVVTWTSSAPAVATVNSAGLVTALTPGTTTITATSGSKSDGVVLTVSPVPVNSVGVVLNGTTIFVGSTTQAVATTRDVANNVLTGRVITWSSGNTAVATVNSSGLVTGVAPGTASITAVSEGRSGAATITVTLVPVDSVEARLADSTIFVGATVQGSTVLRAAGGAILTGRSVTWSSSNASIATVNASGLVTALAVGTVNIIATVEGRTDAVPLSISLAPVATVDARLADSSIFVGQTVQGSTVLRDANTLVLTGRTVTWASSNTAIATVNASGLVSAVAAGTVTITATSEGQSDGVVLTITPAPVATVAATVNPTSIQVGGTSAATAVTRDANNNVLTGRAITWASSNSAVATVNASGAISGVSPGSVTITATSEGVNSNAAPLTVTAIPVDSVEARLADSSIFVGQTVQASAITRAAGGAVLTGRTITWASSNPGIATVNASGLVSAVAAGTVTITATSEGRSDGVVLTITIAPVATVTASVNPTSIQVGGTSTATAVTRDANSNVLTGRTVTWASSNPAVATVNASGVISGVSVGSVTITATSESVNSNAVPLTVTAIPVDSVEAALADSSIFTGQTVQASAITRAAGGAVLTGRAIAWASSNTGVATVNASGLVSAVAVGTVTITATSEGRSDGVALTITAAPVATVAASVSPSSISVGGTSSASAVTRDANNNVLTGRTVTWASSNTAVATVTAGGVISGVSPGSVTITATSEGVNSNAAPLTVTAIPVDSVEAALADSSIFTGQTVQASAITRAAGGAVLTGRTITWASSNTGVATVNASGLVTAVTAGTVTITATSEGRSDGVVLTITAAPVATVTASVNPTSIPVGGASTGTAVTRDANNNVLTGRTVTWASSNSAVATVNASGAISGVSAGSVTITATSEGVSSNAVPLTVTTIPVDSVEATLADSSIVVGQTVQGSAITRDAGGVVLTGRAIAWGSSNTGVATVNASGLVTAVAAGTVTITATSEGRSDGVVLTITVAPVATVTASVNPTSIQVGGTSTGTAVTRDANNNVLTGRTITWASSNTAVATVNASGVINGVSAGSVTITATSESVNSNAVPLTVTAIPVDSVETALADSSIFVGQTVQASAVTRSAGGAVLTGRTITWASSNTSVATVNASGLVTAVAAGTVTITATSEGRSDGVVLTITVAPVATVTASVNPTSIQVGGTSTGTAVTRDANNNVLTGRTVTWASSNNAVATVNASGVISGVSAGSVTITATSESVNSNAVPLTVTAIPVDSVETALVDSSVVVGQTVQASAVTRSAGGAVLTGRTITWASSNTGIATVNASGLVSAIAAGTVTITATSEGRSDGVVLTITVAPVATVTASVSPGSIEVGGTSTATAVTRDANNNVLTGRTVTWASSNSAVATVNASGVISGVSAGSVTITATSESVNSNAVPLTVTAIPVDSVETALVDSSIVVGQTVQGSAITRSAGGAVLTGRTITWASSNTSVATVNASGLVTAVAAGTVTITATSEGRSDGVVLTISEEPVNTVEVTLTPSSIAVAATAQGTAVLRGASNATLTGRTVTWASSDTNIATVSSTGVITAISAGTVTISATSEGRIGSAQLVVTP